MSSHILFLKQDFPLLAHRSVQVILAAHQSLSHRCFEVWAVGQTLYSFHCHNLEVVCDNPGPVFYVLQDGVRLQIVEIWHCPRLPRRSPICYGLQW